MFSTNNIPCVGASIGIERVFVLLEKKMMKEGNIKENPSDCIVAAIPSKDMDINSERLKIYDLLWEAGLKCDIVYKFNWNLTK